MSCYFFEIEMFLRNNSVSRNQSCFWEAAVSRLLLVKYYFVYKSLLLDWGLKGSIVRIKWKVLYFFLGCSLELFELKIIHGLSHSDVPSPFLSNIECRGHFSKFSIDLALASLWWSRCSYQGTIFRIRIRWLRQYNISFSLSSCLIWRKLVISSSLKLVFTEINSHFIERRA